jgi:hypothetical protein
MTLDTFAESRLDLSGIQQQTSKLPFAANCYDDGGNPIGMLNVRYYPQLDLSQADARSATNSDVQELDAALKENTLKEMKAIGKSITSWGGTVKTDINGITAFITEYHRPSLKRSGNFRVRLVRVFAGDRSFTLTISYSDAAPIALQTITDRIVRSLKLTGVAVPSSATSRPLVSDTSSFASTIMELYRERWGWVLLASAIIVFAPPLLIRFVFLRRPISKGWAIGLAALFCMFNMVLLIILGIVYGNERTPNAGLALGALASYAILTKGEKAKFQPWFNKIQAGARPPQATKINNDERSRKPNSQDKSHTDTSHENPNGLKVSTADTRSNQATSDCLQFLNSSLTTLGIGMPIFSKELLSDSVSQGYLSGAIYAYSESFAVHKSKLLSEVLCHFVDSKRIDTVIQIIELDELSIRHGERRLSFKDFKKGYEAGIEAMGKYIAESTCNV